MHRAAILHNDGFCGERTSASKLQRPIPRANSGAATAQNGALCNMAAGRRRTGERHEVAEAGAAELNNELHTHAVGVRKREAWMPSVFGRSKTLNEAGQGGT
jgi:hypothetical protein